MSQLVRLKPDATHIKADATYMPDATHMLDATHMPDATHIRHWTLVSVMSKTSVAFAGIAALGLELP